MVLSDVAALWITASLAAGVLWRYGSLTNALRRYRGRVLPASATLPDLHAPCADGSLIASIP
jgi:hypothetical protein